MNSSEQHLRSETLARFVLLATADGPGPSDAAYRSALQLLETHGWLAELLDDDASQPAWTSCEGALHAALVVGRVDVLALWLEELGGEAARAWVRSPGGPYPERQPLHYVTYSKLHRQGTEISAGLLRCAERLLEAAADPDATFPATDFPESHLRGLYGACGVANFPDMAALLLDRGANIDDGESLYHSLEFADLRCFELLLARGVTIDTSNALNHSLDLADSTATRRLLEEGADPNLQNEYNGAPPHWAISRGRGVERLRLLAEAGADLRLERTGDASTPYQVAAQTAHLEAVEWLEGVGAATPLRPLEAFILECALGNEERARDLAQEHGRLFEDLGPWQVRAYLELAERGRSDTLERMYEAGFPLEVANDAGQTALHWAAWHGQAATVGVLLAAGAALEPLESEFGCTPLGWAAHGCANWPNPAGDYPGAARQLISAGADLTVENNWGVGLIGLAGSNREMETLLRAAGAPT